MHVKQTQVATHTLAKQNFAIGLIGLFLLSCAAFYSQQAAAETNVSGVEIEIISEPVTGGLIGDPVQDFLADVDANDQNQDDLWARIKDGYAMTNVESQYTSSHETWYASRPDYIKRMVERSQRYLFHIVEEVQKRGMPTEIALLPMIESAFNPQANSRSRASGIWQFIPSTGKSFGLKQNWWVDNRRDVTAATNAALDYLQKLHGMFGSWDLALAAYNAGEGTVQRAIDRNRRQGLPTDYQSLDLPAETKNYVPKLQAIKNIVTDPEKFGLKIGSIPNRPYFARVTTPKQIDAKLAAQLAEISYEEFTSLNPSYNRPVITSTGEKHQLLLPVWAAERFADNLANYDKPLTSWQTYNAKRGERMDNIANKFGINVSQLRDVNGLSATKKLRNSQAMLVPAVYSGKPISDASEIKSDTINIAEMENNNNISQASENQASEREPVKRQPVTHKVKNGETLQALAAKYDTDAKALMKINHLKNGKLKAGQTLKINDAVYTATRYKNNSRESVGRSKIKNSSSHSRFTSSHSRFKSKKTTTHRHISARSHIRLR
ncbi:MAG: transglycosylase SLT domain-containing protein [Methylotenera sp.]